MNIRIARLAQQEIDDAVTWYDFQSSGLGVKFLDDFDVSIRRVVAYPLSCEEIEPGLRRCLLSKFPFGIIYGIDDDTIVVLAVAHLHRRPRYWIDVLD